MWVVDGHRNRQNDRYKLTATAESKEFHGSCITAYFLKMGIEIAERGEARVQDEERGQGKLLFLIQEGKSNFQNDMKSLLKTQTIKKLSFFGWTLQQMFVNNKETEKRKM